MLQYVCRTTYIPSSTGCVNWLMNQRLTVGLISHLPNIFPPGWVNMASQGYWLGAPPLCIHSENRNVLWVWTTLEKQKHEMARWATYWKKRRTNNTLSYPWNGYEVFGTFLILCGWVGGWVGVISSSHGRNLETKFLPAEFWTPDLSVNGPARNRYSVKWHCRAPLELRYVIRSQCIRQMAVSVSVTRFLDSDATEALIGIWRMH